MELKVTTLEGKEAGSVQLSDEIFGLEPRKDIIQRCVQWQLNKRQCTVLYRIIEVIGAWSMLDLFMISILVTLVDLGAVATIEAGTGATAFATVVVLTMFAAMSFDPRLIWDLQEDNDDR